MSTIAARLEPGRRWVIDSPIAGPLITLVVVFILFSLFVPNFFTVRSMAGIVNAATLTGTITIGITLLMIAGEFDLSVGPMMAMGAFLYGVIVEGGNPLLALILALLVPSIMGAVNGIIVNRTRIPSFITTLSTMFIYTGVVTLSSNVLTDWVSSGGFTWHGMDWLFGGGQMFQTIEMAPVYDIFNGRMNLIADAI